MADNALAPSQDVPAPPAHPDAPAVPTAAAVAPAPTIAAPSQYTIHLNLRVGPEKSTRRANGALNVPATWTFVVADGLPVLRAQVQQRVQPFDGYSWPADNNLLLQPTLSASQNQLQILSTENYEDLMSRAYRKMSTRRAGLPSSKLEMWVYLTSTNANARQSAGGVRRATSANVSAAMERINSALALPDNAGLAQRIGPVATRHWALTEARRPVSSTTIPTPLPQAPATNTFRQALWIDDQAAQIAGQQRNDLAASQQDLKTIEVELFGNMVR